MAKGDSRPVQDKAPPWEDENARVVKGLLGEIAQLRDTISGLKDELDQEKDKVLTILMRDLEDTKPAPAPLKKVFRGK